MRAKYFVSALAIVLACLPAAAHATDGTWTNTGTGDTTGTPWTTTSNWQGGTVANGTDGNAYFNTLTLTNEVKIYIDANGGVQPIGNMYFGDNASTKHLWKIRETGSSTVDYLQLGVTSGSPTIDVASGVTFDYNNAYVALEGTQGFTKTSAGTMSLGQGPDSITGDIHVNGGTLQLTGVTGATESSAATKGIFSNTTARNIYVASGAELQAMGEYAMGTNTSITLQGGTLDSADSSGNGNYINNLTLTGAPCSVTNSTGGGANGFRFGYGGNATIQVDASASGSTMSALLAMCASSRSGGSAYSVTVNVAKGSATNDLTLTSTPEDSGSGTYETFDKEGAGTLLISTYNGTQNSGTIIVGGGTLAYGASNLLNNSAPLNINGGTLDLRGYTDVVGPLTLNAGSITGGTLTENSLYVIALKSGSVSANLAGTGVNLTKDTSGTVTLSGVNTYTGTTAISAGTLALSGGGSINSSPMIDVQASTTFDVSAVTGGYSLASGQTLEGKGTIHGATTIASGATLSPGESNLGTLTFDNTLTLAGIIAMGIAKSGSTLTSDLVQGVTTLTYGGVLNVTATGGAIAGGDSWDLFNATAFAGVFSSVNLPTLTGGLTWNTSQLAVNGTISVNSVPEPGAMALLATGVLSLLAYAWRKRR